MNEITLLRQEIAQLKSRLDAYERTNIVPISLEKALQVRGFVDTDEPAIPPALSAGPGLGFNEEIALSGDAETITVVSMPATYMQIKNRPNHYIPIYKVL